MGNEFGFRLIKAVGEARAGLMKTPHGRIETPVFMPVGTRASVKSLNADDLEELGAEIILGNTYHLYLRPGHELIYRAGGLHSFMNWPGPILTDSGGFQVSSLGLFKEAGAEKLSKITDEGVYFRSHLDGSRHFFTPGKSMDIQAHLGSDIVMAFDEATPMTTKQYAREAMVRTHEWLKQSKDRFDYWSKVRESRGEKKQALFGIIQGGNFRDLRRESAKVVIEMDLEGIALGGATIGQTSELTEENMSWIRDLLPQDKPRYMMGVGVSPQDAIAAVLSGADMFDCVAPTKLARSGLLYKGKLQIPGGKLSEARFESEFEKGRMNLSNKRYEEDFQPIDEECKCYTCVKGYSRAYLRHLLKLKELTYYNLATIHNVSTMIKVVKEMRTAILDK